MTLGILELLRLRGFEVTGSTKLVRHQDARFPIQDLVRRGWLETYQGYQRRPVFHRADFIVSLTGLDGSRARFFGVFEKTGVRLAEHGPTPPGCEWALEWRRTSQHFYELRRLPGFEDLEDRVIVDWGPGTRSWVQKAKDKPVLEVLPAGRSLPPFADYLEFTLSHAELVELFANEEAHREWRSHLEAVAGVYLILAETTGALYVGSASGDGGIWARWRDYAKNSHGHNAVLADLVRTDPTYPDRFRFSILQVLPKSMTRDEVLTRERLFKEKLGTRATGLNLN